MRALLLLHAVCVSSLPDDLVSSLPTYGRLSDRQYAGFAPVTADAKNQLHYWFVECKLSHAEEETRDWDCGCQLQT